LRLIEEFLAKSGTGRCVDFKETAEAIAKIGFKMFLNITPMISNWSADSKEFSLVFEENPLAEFVELPQTVPGVQGDPKQELWYSNIYCGIIRGALEMVFDRSIVILFSISCPIKQVQMQVEANFITDQLRGADQTEMKVKLVRFIDEDMPPE
jgi:hypothetical protein